VSSALRQVIILRQGRACVAACGGVSPVKPCSACNFRRIDPLSRPSVPGLLTTSLISRDPAASAFPVAVTTNVASRYSPPMRATPHLTSPSSLACGCTRPAKRACSACLRLRRGAARLLKWVLAIEFLSKFHAYSQARAWKRLDRLPRLQNCLQAAQPRRRQGESSI